MKVVFTPEAEQQAERCDSWWRENGRSARDLFARELAEAKALLVEAPNIGVLYTMLDGQPVRRVLMRLRRLVRAVRASYGYPGASSTSRTFLARSAALKGLATKCVPGSSTP